MRIIYQNRHKKSVTGGHKYNDAFEDYLEKLSGLRIDNRPQLFDYYKGWKQYFAPFLELKQLATFGRKDLIFWGDTTFKYHTLLLIFSILFRRTYNVVIIHHFLWLGKSGFLNNIYKIWMNFYYGLMDTIIVPSPYTKNIAEKTFSNKTIRYIPLPFENKFDVSDIYETGNLLYVGTIEKRKGILYLLKAMVYAKNEYNITFTLNVIGKVVEEQYKSELDGIVTQNELRVNFLGRVSERELDLYYKKAEIFAFPSLLEGYGIVLVEAMQRGLPIVCFNNSAMPYSVKNDFNGYLSVNEDYKDFANNLIKIYGNVSVRKKLQSGIKETMADIKTKEDFERSIREFWNTINQK